MALNNLAACARYTEKLRRELVAEVPSIFQDDPPTQQLMVRVCVCLGAGRDGPPCSLLPLFSLLMILRRSSSCWVRGWWGKVSVY